MEIIRSLLIILVILLVCWTIWVLFLTIIKFWKTKRLFKSSYNSVWKSAFSTSIIIIFFGLSFALIGGSINALERIERSLTELTVNYNLHFAYAELDTLEFENQDYSQTSETNEDISEYSDYEYYMYIANNSSEETLNTQAFLEIYFNYNESIFAFFILLEIIKFVSNFVQNDTFTNLVWKYELSYFMDSESSSEGYYYICLNNYDLQKILSDSITNTTNSKDYYLVEDYTDSFLTQNTYSYSSNDPLLVDDYQVVESLTPNGINDIYDDTYIPENGWNGLDYDVKVAVGYEWAEYNDVEPGDVISLPQPFGSDFDALVVATIRIPCYTFPSFSQLKVIPSLEDQTYVLMDTESFLKYFGSVASPTVYIGFANLYNEVETYDDYVSRVVSSYNKDYVNQLNIMFENFFNNIQFYTFNDITNFTSLQASLIFYQTRLTKIINSFLLTIFLILIIVIIAFLIRKKVKSSARELGTLKALGWSNNNIAITYIAFPLTIILLGGTVALIFGLLFQQIWMSLWSTTYLISAGTMVVTWQSVVLTFVLPIFILLSISFLIVKFFLRTPTINLINNTVEYKPSILVKTSGYATRYFKSFTTSYKVKSLSRSIGKSFLLFTSIFFSIIVVSFGLSGAYFITSTTNSIRTTINFDNVFILDSNAYYKTEYVDLAYEDENYLEERYTNQYMFTYEITWDEVKDAQTAEEVWAIADNSSIIIEGTTNYERAQSMDSYFGVYISTETFDNSNTYIPWQAFEILGWAINEVNEGTESTVDNWENQPLGSGLTFNDYQNIYNQYIDLYNYNYFLAGEGEEIIYPNITINTIIYDSTYLVPAYDTSITWTNYFDSNTNEQIYSVWDLGFSLTEKEYQDVVLIDGTWYLADNRSVSLEEYVDSFYIVDESFSTSSADYVVQYAEAVVTNQYTDDNLLETTYGTAEISIYTRNDYSENISNPDERVWNEQWILSVDHADDIQMIIDISDENVAALENYESQQVEITAEDGSTVLVNTIPVIVDSSTLDRFNLEVGDTVQTGYIDEEMQLYNDLGIEKISDYVAIEIVGEINTKIPIGAITTNEFLDPNGALSPTIFFQSGDQAQQDIYSLTNNVYENGTTLLDDFYSSAGLRSSFEYIINIETIQEQVDVVVGLLNFIFYFFAIFAASIAIVLILITLNDIIDNSRKESSILKALGYSNRKATTIIFSPYILIMFIATALAIPVNLLFFGLLSAYIAQITGIYFWFGIPLSAWILIIFSIILLFLLGFLLIIWVMKKANPLEVINDN